MFSFFYFDNFDLTNLYLCTFVVYESTTTSKANVCPPPPSRAKAKGKGTAAGPIDV